MSTFFGSREEDRHLEEINEIFWRCLLGFARTDLARASVETVLDIGCHRGGLLELLARHFEPRSLVGLEPLGVARQEARFRLASLADEVRLWPPERWPELPADSVDLAVCHEVLHLVEDLSDFMGQLARVLRPGAFAYLALGCHTENPLWTLWKPRLVELGHPVFDHAPFEILTEASEAGLKSAMRPLRRDGWVIHDPLSEPDVYPDAASLFDHHFRHKILFRLSPKS